MLIVSLDTFPPLPEGLMELQLPPLPASPDEPPAELGDQWSIILDCLDAGKIITEH